MKNVLDDNEFSEFFEKFGTHKNMVLSTAANGKIHSRMMSIVCFVTFLKLHFKGLYAIY